MLLPASRLESAPLPFSLHRPLLGKARMHKVSCSTNDVHRRHSRFTSLRLAARHG